MLLRVVTFVHLHLSKPSGGAGIFLCSASICELQYNNQLYVENSQPNLLLQVDGRLPVETLVLSLHVCQTCKVIGINEGQVHLRGRQTGTSQ